ncbi:MAG: nicotinate-nucleotide adenylyltransferase [Desulfosalsimonadaceae bacterium]|nr:nicotinate-nucleotide adenylyltransferase [Desulfosalsimonadaceae bacterium]
MKGIGLFGGTFNPIHVGHLRVAEDVRAGFDLEKIVFIPSAIPPHKDIGDLADAQARYAMIATALSTYPDFVASDVEIHRQGPSYTIDTVTYFQNHLPTGIVCYLIVGMDAFLEITTWKTWQHLFDLIPFIVMTRPGTAAASLSDPLTEMENYIHAHVGKGYGYLPKQSCFIHRTKQPVYLTHVTPIDISSSAIRNRVRQGRSIQGLVPDGVDDYIKHKGLYK